MAQEMDNIVVLTDEEGNDVQFEHVVTVTHKNKEYVCLIPIEGIDYGDDEDENALIFLEIITTTKIMTRIAIAPGMKPAAKCPAVTSVPI